MNAQPKQFATRDVLPSESGANVDDMPVQRIAMGAADVNENAEQYRVGTRVEIISILRALAADNVLATVYYDGRERFILSRILAVNPEFEEVIIDCGKDARANQEMRLSAEIVVEAYHHQIKIIFTVQHVELTVFEDRPAFRMRLPSTVLRLQRRSDYRARSPVLASASITSTFDKGEDPITIRVADISCGGIAFVVAGAKQVLVPGARITECVLEMPRIGKLDVILEVRHTADYKDGMGRPMRRVGCRFLHLPGAAATLVQRYINQIDVERRRSALGA